MSTETSIAPRESAGPAPIRRANSVRRTSTLDTDWPHGRNGPMHMMGRARDMRVGTSRDDAELLASGAIEITASPQREILSITSDPALDGTRKLVGVRAGGQSRAAIQEHFPAPERNTPTHLLLDDFAGASLVAGWAWSRWRDTWGSEIQESQARTGKVWVMEGICAGFRPGASSLNPDGTARHDVQSSAPVGSLVHPDDPGGWHELPRQDGVAMRRARWIDVWRDGDAIGIAAGFQDSASDPSGGRQAVHEYRLHARASLDDLTLLEVQADPRILPYAECPAAAANIQRLVGRPLASLRRDVLEQLPGTLGCTHLNDVLRGLADVPSLYSKLELR